MGIIKEVVLLTEPQIQEVLKNLAKEIEEKIVDKTEVLFVGILKGCLFLLADLLRAVNFDADYAFVSAASYIGRSQASVVEVNTKGLISLEGKTVILVDEICDTGKTLTAVCSRMKSLGAKEIYTCVLLDKPSRRTEKIIPDFIGQVIPDQFVVGYGLDLDNTQRALPYIYYREEVQTNREAHEEAAGMGLDNRFFTMNNINPDAIYGEEEQLRLLN
jgi:hypoxanthine phosphoribosyltransferase